MAGLPRSTYYDSRYRQSPALIRARRPYLLKNTLVGLSIATFAISIYAYTLRAIGQDEFEDVKVPDVPTKPGSEVVKR